MKFELTLDAVKRIIFENYNINLTDSAKLLDKDYKICYNSNSQTVILEQKNGQTSNKSSSIPSNSYRINATD